MFKLLRYFTVLSLFSIGAAASLLGIAYRWFAERDMVELTHAYHNELGAMLASSNAFRGELALAASNPEEAFAQNRLSKLLGADLPLSLIAVNAFDTSGRSIYSTGAEAQTSAARRLPGGVSQLLADPADDDGGIVVSAVAMSGHAPVMLELHSNVGLKLDRIARTQTELVVFAIVALGLLHIALLAIVVPADRILRHAQTLENGKSQRKRRDLNDYFPQAPDRRHFRQRLEVAIKRAGKDKHLVAVLFVELRQAGVERIADDALEAVALRLNEVLRKGDILSWMGGGEFAIVLDDIASRNTVGEVTAKVVQALSNGFEIQARTVTLEPRVGISLFPIDASNAEMLLTGAELALKYAKQTSRTIAYYEPRKFKPDGAFGPDFPVLGEVLK